MKKHYTPLLLAILLSTAVQAQKFTHEVGISYQTHSGYFNYYDNAGLQYIPGIRYSGARTYLTAMLPLTFNRMISTSRNGGYSSFEVPVAMEWGFTPGKTGAFKRIHSLFLGTGYTAYNSIQTEYKRGNLLSNNYAFASAGLRLRLGNELFALRFSYGRSVDYTISRNQRLGFSLAYSLK